MPTHIQSLSVSPRRQLFKNNISFGSNGHQLAKSYDNIRRSIKKTVHVIRWLRSTLFNLDLWNLTENVLSMKIDQDSYSDTHSWFMTSTSRISRNGFKKLEVTRNLFLLVNFNFTYRVHYSSRSSYSAVPHQR